MSEHIGVKGKIEYHHFSSLFFPNQYNMSYCHFCKDAMNKVEICLHEGIECDWIEFKCLRCKKTVWIAELKGKDDERFERQKLDKKCFICKKPCGYHNCQCTVWRPGKKREIYLCSKKCNKVMMNEEKRKRKRP